LKRKIKKTKRVKNIKNIKRNTEGVAAPQVLIVEVDLVPLNATLTTQEGEGLMIAALVMKGEEEILMKKLKINLDQIWNYLGKEKNNRTEKIELKRESLLII
jgi:hypothetical protein